MLKLFNDWFDMFNSKLKYEKCSELYAYGINIEKQNAIISNVNEFIKVVKKPNTI